MNRLTARQLAGLLQVGAGASSIVLLSPGPNHSFVDEDALRGLGLIEFTSPGYSLTARGKVHIDTVLEMALPEWEPGRWRTGYYGPGTANRNEVDPKAQDGE